MQAIIAPGARVQSAKGVYGTIKRELTAEVVSTQFGIYKVKINQGVYSVDYKHLTIVE